MVISTEEFGIVQEILANPALQVKVPERPEDLEILKDSPRLLVVGCEGIAVKVEQDPEKHQELLAEADSLRFMQGLLSECPDSILRVPNLLDSGVIEGRSYNVTTLAPEGKPLLRYWVPLRRSRDEKGERQLARLVVDDWPAWRKLLRSIAEIELLQPVKVSGAATVDIECWYTNRLRAFGLVNLLGNPWMLGGLTAASRLFQAWRFFHQHQRSFRQDYVYRLFAAAEPDHFIPVPKLGQVDCVFIAGRVSNWQVPPTYAYSLIQLLHRFVTKFAVPRHLGDKGEVFVGMWLDEVWEILQDLYGLDEAAARDHVMLALLERYVGGFYNDWLQHQLAIRAGKPGGIGDLTYRIDHEFYYQLIWEWYTLYLNYYYGDVIHDPHLIKVERRKLPEKGKY